MPIVNSYSASVFIDLASLDTSTERLAYFRFLICTTAFLKYLRRKNNSHGLEMKMVEEEIMIMDTV